MKPTEKVPNIEAALKIVEASPEEKKELETIYGAEVFEKTELPTSVDDAMKRINASADVRKFLASYKGNKGKDPLVLWALNNLRLAIVTQAANNSVKPNWNDWSKNKYYGIFKMGEKSAAPGVGFSFDGYGIDFVGSGVASRLCLNESKHVEGLYKLFPDLYKQAMLE